MNKCIVSTSTSSDILVYHYFFAQTASKCECIFYQQSMGATNTNVEDHIKVLA